MLPSSWLFWLSASSFPNEQESMGRLVGADVHAAVSGLRRLGRPLLSCLPQSPACCRPRSSTRRRWAPAVDWPRDGASSGGGQQVRRSDCSAASRGQRRSRGGAEDRRERAESRRAAAQPGTWDGVIQPLTSAPCSPAAVLSRVQLTGMSSRCCVIADCGPCGGQQWRQLGLPDSRSRVQRRCLLHWGVAVDPQPESYICNTHYQILVPVGSETWQARRRAVLDASGRCQRRLLDGQPDPLWHCLGSLLPQARKKKQPAYKWVDDEWVHDACRKRFRTERDNALPAPLPVPPAAPPAAAAAAPPPLPPIAHPALPTLALKLSFPSAAPSVPPAPLPPLADCAVAPGSAVAALLSLGQNRLRLSSAVAPPAPCAPVPFAAAAAVAVRLRHDRAFRPRVQLAPRAGPQPPPLQRTIGMRAPPHAAVARPNRIQQVELRLRQQEKEKAQAQAAATALTDQAAVWMEEFTRARCQVPASSAWQKATDSPGCGGEAVCLPVSYTPVGRQPQQLMLKVCKRMDRAATTEMEINLLLRQRLTGRQYADHVRCLWPIGGFEVPVPAFQCYVYQRVRALPSEVDLRLLALLFREKQLAGADPPHNYWPYVSVYTAYQHTLLDLVGRVNRGVEWTVNVPTKVARREPPARVPRVVFREQTRRLREQLLSSPQATLQLVYECAAGLQLHHRCGVLLRDIKPNNLFCSVHSQQLEGRDQQPWRAQRLQVVYGDYGHSVTAVQKSDRSLGTTLMYTPPESIPFAARCAVYDEKSDVYQLGVALLEVLRGEDVEGNDIREYGKAALQFESGQEPPYDALRRIRGIEQSNNKAPAVFRVLQHATCALLRNLFCAEQATTHRTAALPAQLGAAASIRHGFPQS